MNEIVDVFVAVGEFIRGKRYAQAFPGGVGGGVEEGDIDKGGVIDGVLFHIGGFDTLMPFILAIDWAALIERHGPGKQFDKCQYP